MRNTSIHSRMRQKLFYSLCKNCRKEMTWKKIQDWLNCCIFHWRLLTASGESWAQPVPALLPVRRSHKTSLSANFSSSELLLTLAHACLLQGILLVTAAWTSWSIVEPQVWWLKSPWGTCKSFTPALAWPRPGMAAQGGVLQRLTKHFSESHWGRGWRKWCSA